MLDQKFESGSFFMFGNMTSQNFPLSKGKVIEFRYLLPENRLNFKTYEF